VLHYISLLIEEAKITSYQQRSPSDWIFQKHHIHSCTTLGVSTKDDISSPSNNVACPMESSPSRIRYFFYVAPLEVWDVILGQSYMWKHHIVYEYFPHSVIFIVRIKFYRISEVAQPTSIYLVLSKQCRKFIS
jgi:hypothetical protein